MLTETGQALNHRLRKGERRERILMELRLRPHVRITELAKSFAVSTETVRRDVEALSDEGLISRAHGGASALPHPHYPGFDERNRDRIAERARIGRRAAATIRAGDTIMIDAGSTTLQMARFLAYDATPCTVLTNSLHVAMTLGQAGTADVILCPGDVLPSEAAVIGVDTVEFIARHNVGRCFIGASGVTPDGVAETVRGFAAVKRAMLHHSRETCLLADGSKFGQAGLARVAALDEIASVVVDRLPGAGMAAALARAGVEIVFAGSDETPDGDRS
jgi:DeoR/GlpR family transcriptional regulator of sugar metabolism